MSKGIESIRIKGRRIEELPLGLGNQAKEQLPAAIEQERLNAIDTVNAEYPTHRIDYLRSRINECEENKQRMQRTIDSLNTMTSDYKGQISMCLHRDKEVDKWHAKFESLEIDQTEFEQQRKALFKQFPPYNVEAMEQQIIQNDEGIERCHIVNRKEDASIKEFTEVLTLCRQRDKELAKLGAQAEGS